MQRIRQSSSNSLRLASAITIDHGLSRPLYSGVEIDYFHHTSNNDVPVEVIFWHEREDYQPIEIPSTLAPLGPTQRTISLPKHENFEGDTPKWLTGLGGPVLSLLSRLLCSIVRTTYAISPQPYALAKASVNWL